MEMAVWWALETRARWSLVMWPMSRWARPLGFLAMICRCASLRPELLLRAWALKEGKGQTARDRASQLKL